MKVSKQVVSPAMTAALESVGIDPYGPVSKSAALRMEADRISKEAHDSLDGIQPGQPILSVRDRNRRERALEKIRKAGDLLRRADEFDAKESPVNSEDVNGN